MMSQKRQARNDQLGNEMESNINVKANLERKRHFQHRLADPEIPERIPPEAIGPGGSTAEAYIGQRYIISLTIRYP